MKQETKSVERTPKAPRRGDKEEKERRRKGKEKAETKETAEKVREDAAPQNAKGSKKKKNRAKAGPINNNLSILFKSFLDAAISPIC